MLTSSGGSLIADRGRGCKNCQNLADVICERSLNSAGPLKIRLSLISWPPLGIELFLSLFSATFPSRRK